MSDTNTSDVVGCLAALLISPLTVVLNGFVLCKLWLWFVVPQFHLAPLTIPVALGISVLVGMLTHQQTPRDKTSGVWTSIAFAILLPLFTLSVGWVIRLFL